MASRRGHHEGSIYQRGDGRWTATVSLGYEAGRRKRKSFYGDTKREVQDKLTRALGELQKGIAIAYERQTVSQFFERWLEDVVRPNRRPKTYASYSGLVRLHIAPGLGRVVLERLSPQDVQRFLNDRRKAGLSPRTVQYIWAVLRTGLQTALVWGLVPRNVATLIDAPSARRAEIEPMTPDEARAFLAAVKGDRLEALYLTTLALGLRQGEVLGLTWEDVDIENRTLAVRYALQRVGGKLTRVEPKTPKSRRTLRLPEVVVAALKGHRRRQLEERLLAGSRWQETGFVFTTGIGTPLDGVSVTHRFQRLLETHGMRRQRFHDLRHSCATFLLTQNVPARVVMELLGHSDVRLTLNTYTHVLPALVTEAADRMDAVLG